MKLEADVQIDHTKRHETSATRAGLEQQELESRIADRASRVRMREAKNLALELQNSATLDRIADLEARVAQLERNASSAFSLPLKKDNPPLPV